jgi:hypothetical protein
LGSTRRNPDSMQAAVSTARSLAYSLSSHHHYGKLLAGTCITHRWWRSPPSPDSSCARRAGHSDRCGKYSSQTVGTVALCNNTHHSRLLGISAGLSIISPTPNFRSPQAPHSETDGALHSSYLMHDSAAAQTWRSLGSFSLRWRLCCASSSERRLVLGPNTWPDCEATSRLGTTDVSANLGSDIADIVTS